MKGMSRGHRSNSNGPMHRYVRSGAYARDHAAVQAEQQYWFHSSEYQQNVQDMMDKLRAAQTVLENEVLNPGSYLHDTSKWFYISSGELLRG